MQPEGQGGQAERPAGGAAQHLARPPDAEAAGAGGTGRQSVDESFQEGSEGVAEGAGVGGGEAQVVGGNI